MPLKLHGITEYKSQRLLAHAPFVHSLLIENNHTLFGDTYIANMSPHAKVVERKGKGTVGIAHNAVGTRRRFYVNIAQGDALVFAVVAICHAFLQSLAVEGKGCD